MTDYSAYLKHARNVGSEGKHTQSLSGKHMPEAKCYRDAWYAGCDPEDRYQAVYVGEWAAAPGTGRHVRPPSSAARVP